MIKALNRNCSVSMNDGGTDLVISFSNEALVTRLEELQLLVAKPCVEEILDEAARLKAARGLTGSNDQEIEAKLLRMAQHNVLTSPSRGLFGVPETLLQKIVEEKVQLFRLRPDDIADNSQTLVHEVRISYAAMRELHQSDTDQLKLEDGATLLKLATIAGLKEHGTFGYYKDKKLLIFNADIGQMVADALRNEQAASPPQALHRQPDRYAPRAERSPVERPARGSNRPRNS